MSREVIDDIPEQMYLFDQYKTNDNRITSKTDEQSDWLDDVIKGDRIGDAKVFLCDPDVCTDDCNKCKIFHGR